MRNKPQKTTLYGGISNNDKPVIIPVQVSEDDINGKSKPKNFSWKASKNSKPDSYQSMIDKIEKYYKKADDYVKQNKFDIETARQNVDMIDPLNNLAVNTAARGNQLMEDFLHPITAIKNTAQSIGTIAQNPNLMVQAGKEWFSNPERDVVVPFDLGLGAAAIVEGGQALGNMAKNISKVPIKNNTNTLTNINELPKQSPIARATDANPVVGEVKSFEQITKENPKPKTTNNIAKNNIAEDAEILSEGEIDKLQRKRLTTRAEEYAKAQDAIMQSLEEKFGGRENLDNYLDAISSNMTPEEYNQWKTAYLAHQKGVLFGGNPADVLADRSIKTKIDPRLPLEGDVGRYNTETGNIKLAPDTFINKYNRPFEGTFEKDSNINALHHEITHDLNLQAELANAFNKAEGTGIFSKEAELYNQRHGNPTVGNESASFGFESTNLDNQPLKQGLIDEYYKRGGYEHNLSNPEMLNQRNLYKQDIARYKALMESGLLKPDDLRILNEQNLMRRFDPAYQSPLDTMNLKTFEQIKDIGR